ncbi:hypothetical protein [Streptomyces sp. AP-93]|uniref:hypothetical protein n=1 Tax=Streptomyces sp. AP-93 TaxID=2929048 RepID=UPI0027E4979C|nr:hypothetical protein [Streptomyces sp. AP-93]
MTGLPNTAPDKTTRPAHANGPRLTARSKVADPKSASPSKIADLKPAAPSKIADLKPAAPKRGYPVAGS